MRATNENGNSVESDGSVGIGGHESAMRPMQMLASSLGCCSSIDVISFLRKMRQPLEDIQIHIDAERDEDNTPSLFTKIHVSFELQGELEDAKVKRAVDMSMEKYCSVARILEKTAELSWNYKILTEKA